MTPATKNFAFSAVLLSWKRPYNLPRILTSLKEIPYISEILLWNNNPEVQLKFDGVTTINSEKNFFCFPRYLVATLAQNENLWFQDDDLEISREQFIMLAREYKKDPSRVYGFRGQNLENGKVNPVRWDYGDVDLILGQTTMFHKSLLQKAISATLDSPFPTYPLEDDVMLSLSSEKKPFALNMEPLIDLGSDDDVALFKQEGFVERRQQLVDWFHQKDQK